MKNLILCIKSFISILLFVNYLLIKFKESANMIILFRFIGACAKHLQIPQIPSD